MKWIRLATFVVIAAGVTACEQAPQISANERPLTTAQARLESRYIALAPQIVQEIAATSESTAISDSVAAVPDEIRAFVPQDSTLLAYKRFDLTGDKKEDAVLIIRHPVTETNADFSNNPCDLIVLHGATGGFFIAAKNSKVVDCTYKVYMREIANRPDELNDMLELKPHEITSYEEAEKSTGVSTTYSFNYSSKKNDWHLSYAEAVFARSDRIAQEDEELEELDSELNVYTQEARYPKDIRFISLSRFDRDDKSLLRAMTKNQKKID